MRKIISTLLLVLVASVCMAQYSLESPNNEIRVSFETNRSRKGLTSYLVPKIMKMKVATGHEVLTNKEIGITVKSKGRRHSLGKGDVKYINRERNLLDHPDAVDSFLVHLTGRYNNLVLAMDNGIMLEVRAYNNGVAYRFIVSGYPEDFKILDVCDVFPRENPVAIQGTYEGEYISPWSVMKVEYPAIVDYNEKPKSKKTTYSYTVNQRARVVSWRDALSSVSMGYSYNWHAGNTWGDFADYHKFHFDFTYKYIYGAVDFNTCGQLQYIPWGEDFWPFKNVMGQIDSWGMGVSTGFCLPIQRRSDVWSFIPYISTSMMHLHQHRQLTKLERPLDQHNHWLVGPGIKVQLAQREGLVLGFGYEFQFFTDKKSPTGMHSYMMTIGKMF